MTRRAALIEASRLNSSRISAFRKTEDNTVGISQSGIIYQKMKLLAGSEISVSSMKP